MANLIFIGAYWVKDVLWLGLLCIVGSLVVMPYLLQTEPIVDARDLELRVHQYPRHPRVGPS